MRKQRYFLGENNKNRRINITMKKFTWLLVAVGLIFLLWSGVVGAYNEAPMLKEKVEQGILPPVEKRLPEEPLVIKPLNEIGKYGGTWHRLSDWTAWGYMNMALDGENFTRFRDEDLKVVPNLIKNWESNKEMTSYTLYFRKNLKWSDGELCTVDDFLFYWNDMALNEECVDYGLYDYFMVGGKPMTVKKMDDYTLQLDFVVPNPSLIDQLAMWSNYTRNMYIFPAHYLKEFHPKYNSDYTNYEEFVKRSRWMTNVERPVLTAWMPVKIETGKRVILERNPFYYATDTAGNQLPYIDRIEIEYVSDPEVFKLKIMQGEVDMQIRPSVLGIRDISLLKRNEEKYNYKTLMWKSGNGTGPVFMPNRNHPEPDKQALYRNPTFLKAISHAIDRPKIKKMVYYGFGYPTTGTYTKNSRDFVDYEEGKKLFEEWRDLAVEYDPEKTGKMLDQISVVDKDGDGWRDMPDGGELTLRIDIDSASGEAVINTIEIVKKCWDDVGLRTVINTMDRSKMGVIRKNGTFDIYGGWDLAGPINIIQQPNWLVPMVWYHWAPLYGTWFQLRGSSVINTELEKEPRDRTPPREKPESGSAVDKLQKLYLEAKATPDVDRQAELVREMIRIHLEEGPFFIGTVAEPPRIGVVKNNFKNVPEKLTSGWIQAWTLGYIATLNPDTFYIDDQN